MKKITLYESPVLFIEDRHEYWNGIDRLEGVTSILKKVLFPSKYADIDPAVLANAASRGTAIHNALQAYDMSAQMDFSSEYSQDIRECATLWAGSYPSRPKTLACEYLVSNEQDIASKVDIVAVDDKGHITLADIKTTSTYDPEYLSWQLSVYAYLFERQNPKLKANNLVAYWFHKVDGKWQYEQKDVERKTDEEVEQLFDWWRKGEVHEAVYVPEVLTEATLPAQVIDIAQMYADLEEGIKQLTATKDEFRAGLLVLMNEYGIEKLSIADGRIQVTKVAATTRTSFDATRFKQENQQLYKQYEKTAQVKETIKITIK